MSNIWLHRYSVLLSVCTLFLIAAGASVTSTDSGLAVPDWPLSYGKVMPEMTGGIFYEHGHRMVATTVGMLTIGLVVWLRLAEPRRWLRRLGLAGLAAVVVQGVLGGLTVLFLLPRPVSIAHACLAQLFFSTTVLIALFTSPAWLAGPRPVDDPGRPSLRTLALSAPVCVFGQLILGAAYRHQAIGIVPHILGAMAVTAVVLVAAVSVLVECRDHPALRRPAIHLLSITFLQVFLGIAALLSRISSTDTAAPPAAMVWFTVLHVAVGALTMAAAVKLAAQVVRNVRPRLAALAGTIAATP